jgi:hypothetical protein
MAPENGLDQAPRQWRNIGAGIRNKDFPKNDLAWGEVT